MNTIENYSTSGTELNGSLNFRQRRPQTRRKLTCMRIMDSNRQVAPGEIKSENASKIDISQPSYEMGRISYSNFPELAPNQTQGTQVTTLHFLQKPPPAAVLEPPEKKLPPDDSEAHKEESKSGVRKLLTDFLYTMLGIQKANKGKNFEDLTRNDERREACRTRRRARSQGE